MNEPRITETPPLNRWRLLIFYAAMALVFGLYTLRLLNLQIVDWDLYRQQAEDNRTSEINLQTQRGIIYDRNGTVLARNAPSYNVVIVPADLPGNPTMGIESYRELFGVAMSPEIGAVSEVYRQLSQLLQIPVTNPNAYDEDGLLRDEVAKVFKPCANDLGITEIVLIGDTNAPYSPVQIACNIDSSLAMLIRERSVDLPGVGIEVRPIREYPTGYTTAEVVGFLGPIPASLEQIGRAHV